MSLPQPSEPTWPGTIKIGILYSPLFISYLPSQEDGLKGPRRLPLQIFLDISLGIALELY